MTLEGEIYSPLTVSGGYCQGHQGAEYLLVAGGWGTHKGATHRMMAQEDHPSRRLDGKRPLNSSEPAPAGNVPTPSTSTSRKV
jgi:hypothetical protein